MNHESLDQTPLANASPFINDGITSSQLFFESNFPRTSCCLFQPWAADKTGRALTAHAMLLSLHLSKEWHVQIQRFQPKRHSSHCTFHFQRNSSHHTFHWQHSLHCTINCNTVHTAHFTWNAFHTADMSLATLFTLQTCHLQHNSHCPFHWQHSSHCRHFTFNTTVHTAHFTGNTVHTADIPFATQFTQSKIFPVCLTMTEPNKNKAQTCIKTLPGAIANNQTLFGVADWIIFTHWSTRGHFNTFCTDCSEWGLDLTSELELLKTVYCYLNCVKLKHQPETNLDLRCQKTTGFHIAHSQLSQV